MLDYPGVLNVITGSLKSRREMQNHQGAAKKKVGGSDVK